MNLKNLARCLENSKHETSVAFSSIFGIPITPVWCMLKGTQGVRTGKAPRGQSTYQTAHEQVEDSEARWKRGLQTPCLLLFPH